MAINHTYTARILGSITEKEIAIDSRMMPVPQHQSTIALAERIFLEDVVTRFATYNLVLSVATDEVISADDAAGAFVLISATPDSDGLVITTFLKRNVAKIIIDNSMARGGIGGEVSQFDGDQSPFFVFPSEVAMIDGVGLSKKQNPFRCFIFRSEIGKCAIG